MNKNKNPLIYTVEQINLIQKRRSSLISPRVSKKLLNLFGGNAGHNLDPDNYTLGYGLFHYAFITNTKPSRVLCIGSEKGFIPAICALACKETGKGHVDFVDAGYNKNHPDSWGGTGFWKNVNPEKHFSQIGLSTWITTHVMKSEEFAHMGSGRSWQYIYIDANHSYKGVKKDFSIFWPKLDKGGYMVFHDVLLKNHPVKTGFGVWKFWKELKNRNKITIPYKIPGAIPSGLGILQK
jgi:hypothetical protein